MLQTSHGSTVEIDDDSAPGAPRALASRSAINLGRRVLFVFGALSLLIIAACSSDIADADSVTDAPGLTPLAKCTDCPQPPPPPPPPTCPVTTSFSATPSTIAQGQSTTLQWSSSVPSGHGCTLSPVTITGGVGTVASSGSRTVTPSTTTTYGMFLGNATVAVRTVTVNVVFPALCSASCSTAASCNQQCSNPNLSVATCGQFGVCQPCTATAFTASPTIVTSGGSTTISWATTGNCTTPPTLNNQGLGANSGQTSVTPGFSTMHIPLPGTYAYTLREGATTLATLNVTVVQPVYIPPAACSSICSSAAACNSACSNESGSVVSCNSWSYSSAGDADLDGVPDALENELARRFAPTMHLLTTDFRGEPHGDWGQLYSGSAYGGNWPFVVRPVTAYRDTTSIVTVGGRTIATGSLLRCGSGYQCLEIVYAFPYNWDTGGPFGVGDHRGDAEMYSVLVARKDPKESEGGTAVTPAWNYAWADAKNDASKWIGYSEFGTAHTCDQYDSSSHRFRTFRPDVDGPSEIWVSQSKHANYFSKDACNNGACSGDIPGSPCWDTCDDIHFTMVFANQYGGGSGPLKNAGEQSCHSHSSINPSTLYPGDVPSTAPYASYDVWADIPFGDDEVGRPLVLLRAGTMVWWQDDHLTGNPDSAHPYGPYQCWPGPTSFPSPPPHPPLPPCGNGTCCNWAQDGTCSTCIPENAQCP